MLINIQYEKSLWDKGVRYIAGVDEVGRGPLAGPMVVCAVVLDLEQIFGELPMINDVDPVENTVEKSFYSQIRDSKTLTEKKRRELDEKIRKEAISYSIVRISNTEIDSQGISAATQKAFFEAVSNLPKLIPEHILTDMFPIKKLAKEKQTNIKKGDSLSISIGAASIVAKVYRDALMVEYHAKYPQYGFDQHKGYGTVKHIEAIRQNGPCDIHRLSFEPLKSMFAK